MSQVCGGVRTSNRRFGVVKEHVVLGNAWGLPLMGLMWGRGRRGRGGVSREGLQRCWSLTVGGLSPPYESGMSAGARKGRHPILPATSRPLPPCFRTPSSFDVHIRAFIPHCPSLSHHLGGHRCNPGKAVAPGSLSTPLPPLLEISPPGCLLQILHF